jgi:glycosyltransferase involved in cell wall biosynthesis
MARQVLCYFINVDWYFSLHWMERAVHCISVGYDVHVLCKFTDDKIRSRLQDAGIVCHNVHLERRSLNPLSLLRSYREARKILRDIKPDILHCITVKANIIGGMLSRQWHLPRVFSVTGTGIAFSSDTAKARLARRVTVALYKLALSGNNYAVLFENQSDCQLFLQLGLGDASRNQVIAGAGVDIARFAYCVPPSRQPCRVLFAARMLWDKGLEDVIAAAEILRQQGVVLELNVAGLIDVDTHTAIPESTLRGWHIAGLINWLGAVKDMPQLICDSDIVVLPTYYGEGVPRILIEAASCGRPCVATDVPGCNDIVVDGETGYLVPLNSPQALAQKIARLLQDQPLRHAMGLKARALVESRFEQSIVIGQTMAVYQRLLAATSDPV